MTEGLSGFGEFLQAVENLQRAAAGGSLDDGFAENARQHPPGPGYVQAEDGSWVPPSFWDDPPDNGSLDDGFAANAEQHPYQPGYIQAEDGGWVPPEYYD